MNFTKSEYVVSIINFESEVLEKIYITDKNLYYDIRDKIEHLLFSTEGIIKVNMVMNDWFEYRHKENENISNFLSKIDIACENLIRTMKEKTD